MTDTLVLPYSRSLLYSKAPFHCHPFLTIPEVTPLLNPASMSPARCLYIFFFIYNNIVLLCVKLYINAIFQYREFCNLLLFSALYFQDLAIWQVYWISLHCYIGFHCMIILLSNTRVVLYYSAIEYTILPYCVFLIY